MRTGVLARYLIRVHIGPFLFSLSAITGLIVVNSVAQRVDALVGKGLPWSVLGEFVLLSLPHTIALSLPMSVLVAVLYAFSQLTASNEITAMAAGGIRPLRIMLPVLALGAIAAGVMFYFNDTVLPESNHRLKNLLLDIGRKSPTLDLREQVVNELRAGTGIDRYFLTAERIDHETSRLATVTIFDGNDPMRQRTTYAASGEMAFNDARTDLYLTLHDGFVHEVQRDREGGFQRVYFERQIVPLRGVGNELERRVGGTDRSDREMGFDLLAENARTREQQRDSAVAENRAQTLEAVRYALNEPNDVDTAWVAPLQRRSGRSPAVQSASLLSQDPMTQQIVTGTRSRAARVVALEQSVNRYRVEIHKKMAIALACIVFTLIGPPLALRFPRGGVGFVLTGSAIIFFIYWAGLLMGEAAADRRLADPAVTMWLGNVVMAVVGAVLVAGMGRAGATNRGGGGLGESLSNLVARARSGPGPRRAVESTG